MSFAFAGSVTSFTTTILSYFSPSKSPFYSVIAFGTISLILSCTQIAQNLWLWVAIPIFSVLALCAALSFKDRTIFEGDQGEDQLRFARSFSISSALLTFVVTAKMVGKVELAFWINYCACIAQIVVFLLYAWARSGTLEQQRDLNFVQFALITATFLIGASTSNVLWVSLGGLPGDFANYFLVSVALYALWLSMLLIWIKHLKKLIRIHIPHAEKSRKPNNINKVKAPII
jgi:hypothetical protein